MCGGSSDDIIGDELMSNRPTTTAASADAAASAGAAGTAPRVSVIIPAYNAEKWLGRTLESVLAQTYAPHEILVVDDGSKDGTAQLAESFGPRITCIRQVNAGAAAAENHALRRMTGDWMALLDADDYWEPYRLEAGVALVRQHPELRWVAGSYLCWWPDGAKTRMPVGELFETDPERDIVIPDFFAVARQPGAFATCAFLIRRDVFDEVGFFDERMRTAYDLDMWYRIAVRYPAIGFVKRPVFVYDRRFEGSLTRVNRSISAYYWLLVSNHLPAGSRPFTLGQDGRDRVLQDELRRAIRHALRFGEKENIRRLLRDYSAWYSAKERLVYQTACLAPRALLNWAGRQWHLRNARAQYQAAK